MPFRPLWTACNTIIISFYRVGGVSIGSLIGALWAIHRDFNKMKKLAEDWFEMIHYDYLGHAGNLTYPYISLFSGDYFNTTVKRTVGKLCLFKNLSNAILN
jgi:predicted acylesterase/phospholipase RssA